MREGTVTKKKEIKGKILIFHEQEYFADALGVWLGFKKEEYEWIDESSKLMKALRTNRDRVLICEDRPKPLKEILEEVICAGETPPVIVLFTFSKKERLKKTLVRTGFFPELGECLKLGFVHHLQLPIPTTLHEKAKKSVREANNGGSVNADEYNEIQKYIRIRKKYPAALPTRVHPSCLIALAIHCQCGSRKNGAGAANVAPPANEAGVPVIDDDFLKNIEMELELGGDLADRLKDFLDRQHDDCVIVSEIFKRLKGV